MRLAIVAVGRLKAGPERALYERYAARIGAAGKAVGLSLLLREVPEGRSASARSRMAEEATAIAPLLAEGRVVVLDERGKSGPSAEFAERLRGWRDGGAQDASFVIGGADGLDESIRKRADLVLSFGAATWPHQLVRIMLAEQLYRAVTILSGHPYHRANDSR